MGDRLVTIDRGRKLGGGYGCPFWGRAWSSSNTMCPGPRSISLPSGILIHPAVCPQHTWANKWGLCPFWGRGSCVPVYHNVAWAEAYLATKWRLDPASRLATIHGPKSESLCYQAVVLPVCPVSLSVTLVYCGQTVGCTKMKLDMEVHGHIVLDGDPALLP